MVQKISAQHILVDRQFEAEDLKKKLEQGASFEQLAKEYSSCPSGKDGGNLGEFGKGMMVVEFETAAFALDVGAVSAPVKTQFGHHLIKRLT